MKNKMINKLLNSQARENKKNKNTNGVKHIRLNKITEKLSNKQNEIKGKLDNSRFYILSEMQRWCSSNLRRNMKIFAVEIERPIDSDFELKENYLNNFPGIDKIELIDFSLTVGEKTIFNKLGIPERRQFTVLLGLHSVIGYNPFLIDMLEKFFFSRGNNLKVFDLSNEDILSFFKKAKKEGRVFSLNCYTYHYNKDPVFENICSNIDDRITENLKKDIIYVIPEYKNKPFLSSLHLLIKNNSFDLKTLILAVATARNIGITSNDEKVICDQLKNKFPKQLENINLYILFDLYSLIATKFIEKM